MSEWAITRFPELDAQSFPGAGVMCQRDHIIFAGPMQTTPNNPLVEDPNWIRFYFARPLQKNESDYAAIRDRWSAVVFHDDSRSLYLPVSDYILMKFEAQ